MIQVARLGKPTPEKEDIASTRGVIQAKLKERAYSLLTIFPTGMLK